MRILRPGIAPSKPAHLYGACPDCNCLVELDKFTRECPTPGCVGALYHIPEDAIIVRALIAQAEPTEGA